MTLPQLLREKMDAFLAAQLIDSNKCCEDCNRLCNQAALPNGLMDRSYTQGVLDHAELVRPLLEALNKNMKHLDNFAASQNEVLCLIRRDTEDALSTYKKAMEQE